VKKAPVGSVLCIGNDPVSLNLRCLMLKRRGWNVLSSGSGHEGILRFGREPVNVVILDLNEGGAEAALIAGELKRLRPGVPVVMVVDDEVLTPGATEQADAVVDKAKESRDLLNAVNGLL
jgi:CheY-like chemotaxis protein